MSATLTAAADPAAFVRAQTTLRAPSTLVPELRLHLADEALPLWQATEAVLERSHVPPPYWAFAWPGGQALTRLLLDEPDRAQGRRVVDFGAGCGIAAIAASKAGARHVLASDLDPFALAAMALNAEANDVALTPTDQDLLDFPADCDLLLLGDMCYEKPLAEKLTAWARAAARTGTTVLLADPGRAYKPSDRLAEVGRHIVPTSLDLEDRESRETIIWRVLG